MSTPLNCASGVELVMEYLEDVLPADAKASVESHVARCSRCRAFLESYRATPSILRRATEVRMPEQVEASLHAFLFDRRDGA
jgi:anti-sigma factor RsiW